MNLHTMTLNEYQTQAHSTAVHGGELCYPISALAEETGEVLNVWGDWVRNAEYLNIQFDVIKAKLLDEIGDVCWNLAELATLVDVDLEDIDKYASANHVNNTVSISYYMCQLAAAVGKVSGIWAKYIRKHGGQQPLVREVREQERVGAKTMRGALADSCILVLHAIHNLTTRLELDFNEVLIHNIKKLADRKQKNTLGGVGSVDTRSCL